MKPQMVKMLVPSLWGDLRTVTSTMVKYGVKAKEVFGLIMDLLQGTALIIYRAELLLGEEVLLIIF